jgi:hypothetical protein
MVDRLIASTAVKQGRGALIAGNFSVAETAGQPVQLPANPAAYFKESELIAGSLQLLHSLCARVYEVAMVRRCTAAVPNSCSSLSLV